MESAGFCLVELREDESHPQYGWGFRMQIRKKSGNTPETLLEQILGFLESVRLEVTPSSAQVLSSGKHRRCDVPVHFQNCPPPSTAWTLSLFGSILETRLEQILEFPARVWLKLLSPESHRICGAQNTFRIEPSQARQQGSLQTFSSELQIHRNSQGESSTRSLINIIRRPLRCL